ncbi:MAG TPA: lysylphosphatidylglycerol synthase domain-containing protein [Myxococcales bacterium]|nr:lysylphosphatidylglycerol synthase domain-containing protein [Myxococcales bacterium]
MTFARVHLRDVVRWLGLALALALLGKLLLGPEAAAGFLLLRDLGPRLLFGLLPFLAFEVIDTAAWRRLIRSLGHAPRYLALLRARMSLEAINLTLPAGAAVAEALTPSLLQRGCEVALGDGVVALAARRWTVLRAHAVYLSLGALAGFLLGVGPAALPWSSLVFAAVASGGASAARRLFTERSGSLRLEALLERLPGRLHVWFARRRASFAAVDRRFEIFAEAEKERWLANTSLYVAAWLTESVETFLLLRLLGARLSFLEVLPVETCLSFVRGLAFLAPAGLGVQDLGYVTLFASLPRPLVLAFIAAKRGKELFWAAAGYLMLLARRAPLVPAAFSANP